MTLYTGEEAVVFPVLPGVVSDDVFEVRSPRIPQDAQAVFDEKSRAVIGYRTKRGNRYLDLNGKTVGYEEEGIEPSWLDPLDLLLIAYGIGRLAVRMAVGRAGALIATRAISLSTLNMMRATYRAIVLTRNIAFTRITARYMLSRSRKVPVHILKLAIQFGKRSPDSRKVKGVYQYVTKMYRNGKSYTLKVVLREKDRTILHFHYY